jgi:carbamoyltransferase
MSFILEDCDDYEIYFSHQCDARTFNRGATKNIGFLAIKEKYPDDYKNITFIFNDVDTIPFYKIFDYETPEGVVKHYYGFKYDLKMSDLKNEKIIENVTPADVAKLLADKKIVALYQGRSEAGPRALGNRSILYDPRDPNGKEHVNTVKRREWFRPFAGTVLLEKAREWFNLYSLTESKFMSFAVDVWPDKQPLIPAITHVDGTCRVQTLKREDNPNYYDLIQEFDKLTGVPIVFNTSFNLAGNTIVETLKDALWTIHNSAIDYLYLPELKVLVTK